MIIVLCQLVEGGLQPENVAAEVVPAADAFGRRRCRFDGRWKDEESSVAVHQLDCTVLKVSFGYFTHYR